MKNITVFCGSSSGNDPIYMEQAWRLGKELARRNIRLIYGGAKVGLMGAVAEGALSERGEVIGVLPHFLRSKEIAHEGLTQLILVDSMHERKTKMHDLSDGVIALPGGFGTMEELFEMLTWAQLGLHQKPIGLLDTKGFYKFLTAQLDTMVSAGLLKEINYNMLLVNANIEQLLHQMDNYVAPVVSKWITEDKV
jgi:uncharacterized protein (TIGR00730 family)